MQFLTNLMTKFKLFFGIASEPCISFNAGTGFNNTVYSVIVDNNDKVYVGGNFTTYKGVANVNRIIRLNCDGSRDTNFIYETQPTSTTNNGFTTQVVYQIFKDLNQDIYVTGGFTRYKYKSADPSTVNNRIIRIHPNGTKDINFNNTTGFGNNTSYPLAFDSQGKLYVGGAFTTYKGNTENRIIKLNTDGSKDGTFDNSTGFNNVVWALAVDNNDKIYCGGQFTTYKGVAANYIIRLNPDGTIDSGFNYGTGCSGLTGTVHAIYVQPDNKVMLVGYFTTYNGISCGKIIRLNEDGSVDESFDHSIGFGSQTRFVRGIMPAPNNKYYVFGNFNTFNGENVNSLIRLNSDGTKDNTFITANGFGGGTYPTVNAVGIDSLECIYAGGTFTTYRGIPAINIIKLHSDGSSDSL